MKSALLPLALAILSGTVAPRLASAQETPYQNHLVGERSLGLAGAFVAVADDPSAIFHNPGGIAPINTSAVAGSLWAIARSSRQVTGGYQTDLGSADLEQSGGRSLPLFLAGVVKFGKKSEDGVRSHALGAALFTPLQRSYRFVDQLEDDSSVDRLEVRHDDGARWLGLSYGYRPRYGLSLGLSVFMADRTLSHDEVEIRARELLPAESAVGSALSRASTLQVDTRHLVVRIGTLLHLTHELHAGIMFQPPGYELYDAAEAVHLDTRVGPDPTQIGIEQGSGLAAHLPLPWELRMGITIVKADSLLTLDLSLFGRDGTSREPLRFVDAGDVDLGVFVPPTLYRRPTLRAALGFEALIAEIVPLRGGTFIERSPSPQLAGITDTYGLDHIDYVGAALGVGIRTGGYDFSIGATAVFGFGDGLGLTREADTVAPARYQATEIEEAMLLVFIGGARSAVRNLVKTLLED